MTLRRALTAIVLVGLLAAPTAQSLETELQRAFQRETTTGNLAAAIAEYQRIARQAGGNRALAAQALLREARSHERLGSPESRKVYEALVRDFSDQSAVVSAARARLSAAGGVQQLEVTPRRVLEAGWSQMWDMSADGRFVVGPERVGYSAFSSGFSIVVRDVATGRSTTVVPATGSLQARLSDDGNRVAFTAGGLLRVVHVSGGASEVLTSDSSSRISAVDWSPDAKLVLAVMSEYADASRPQQETARKLVWVSTETKTTQAIRTFEPWRDLIFDARISPDGRFIAYSARARADGTDRYLYVMDVTGQNHRALVSAAGTREGPAWTPDGSRLVFQGTRENDTALWALAVRDGQAVGEPWVVQENFRGDPLGFTTSGTFLYSTWGQGGGNQAYILNRATPPGERPVVFPGLNASWSQTGSVAIWRNNALVIRNEASGEEQSFRPPDVDATIPPRWLPDGSVIVLVDEGQGAQSRQAFHVVDTRTGTSRRLFGRDANGRLRTSVSAVSPDGRTLYLGVRPNATSGVSGIVAVDVATGDERSVLTFPQAPPPSSGLGLAISPDGTTLAVQTWVKTNAAARIFTVGVDGSNYREIVGAFETGWMGDTLRWTPDGRTLLFVAFDANRHWRVMRVPADGGTPEFDGLSFDTLAKLLPELRLFPGNFNSIDLSPDGSRIMASTQTMSKYELWTLDNLLWAINAR